MKTISRIRRNGPTKTRAAQDKIAQRQKFLEDSRRILADIDRVNRDFGLPNPDALSSCICIYDRAAKTPRTRIPLSDAETGDILALCLRPERPEKTSADVIATALRAELRRPQLNISLHELRNAIVHSIMLSKLMTAGAISFAQGELHSDEIESEKNGLTVLVHASHARLKDAFGKLCSTIHPTGEAAPA